MHLLFLGGTGVISTACVDLALAQGHRVSLLNRGQRKAQVSGADHLVGDLRDEASAARLLGARTWDVVLNFIGFKPDEIERDLRLFSGRTAQYIYISSASAYEKPLTHYLVTENTPLRNPYWEYSRDKIACEERLLEAHREQKFPVTIVRPSLTYGDTQVPLAVNTWGRSYTAIDRMRRGCPVIVPGDGTSLWTMTHNTDFAKGLIGLCGHREALGQAFHITSDEVRSWNQYYQQAAEAAGVPEPKLVHIASETLVACMPELRGSLLGDKAISAIFDNSKIKRFVPEFSATTPFRRGIQKTIDWFDADPARRVIDPVANERWDRVIAWYGESVARF